MYPELGKNLVKRRIVHQETRLLRQLFKMKLSIFVIFCLFVTLQYESVNCGLVKNFLDKGKETIEAVRDDVRNVLHLNKDKDDDNVVATEKTTQQNEAHEAVTSSTTPEPMVTESKSTTPKKDEKIEEESTTLSSSSTTTTAAADIVTTSTESSATNGTEPQQGRENFHAGCAAGYKRTADGRCKATY